MGRYKRKHVGFAIMVVLAVGVAAYAAVAYLWFPPGSFVHPDMQLTFQQHLLGIYTHVFASLVALAIGPLQFVRRLREQRPRLHRWVGRVYLVGVGLGGVSAAYMALFAQGGWVGKLGFSVLACLWLFTAFRGYEAIRRGAVEAHRRWMIRNYALTLSAVTIRLYLPLATVGIIPFEIGYAVITWLCWVPNLIIVEKWLLKRHRASAVPVSVG